MYPANGTTIMLLLRRTLVLQQYNASNNKEKYNHNNTAIPIPLALSRVCTAANKAMATNMVVNNKPTPTNIKPVAVKE